MNYLEKSREELIADIQKLQQQNSLLKTTLDSEIAIRKEVEERCRLNVEKFKDIFEQPLVGISITGADGSMNTNEAFSQILGYSPNELSTIKWQDITHPDDLEPSRKVEESLFSGVNDFARWEKRYIHKNGNIVWVDLTTSVHFDQNKHPLFYITTILDITKRKLAEETLKLSENKFFKIFNSSPDLIILTSLSDGRILEVNEKVLAMTGYTYDEFLGKTTVELNLWADVNDRENYARQLSQKGYVNDLEVKFRIKSGEIRDTVLTGEIIELQSGKVILGIIRDISDQKKAKMAILESEATLSEAMRIARLAYWEYEMLTDQFTFNDQFYHILNTTAEQEGGYTISSTDFTQRFFFPEDQFIVKNEIQAAIQSNDLNYKSTLEHRVLCRDGAVKFFSVNIRIVKDQTGKTVKTSGVNQDITDRKLAEITLSENEERYRLISSVVSDYIFTTKVDEFNNLSLKWVTGAFENITGYSLEEYIAAGGWRSRLHPDDLEKDNRDLDELKKNKQVISDIRTYAKNGKLIWVRVFAHPLWDYQKNKLTGIYGGVKDITESKLAEKALQDNEHMLKLLIEYSPAAIAMFDTNMNYIIASKRFLQDYDIKETNVTGRSHYEIFPEINEKIKEIHQRCLAGEIQKAENDPFQRANGKVDWVRWEIHPWFAQTDLIGGSILFSEVITDRIQAENKIIKANRVYAVISQINQSIVRSHDRNVLFKEVSEIAVKYGQFPMAWIGLADEESKTIIPIISGGREDGYLKSLPTLSYQDIPEGRGPTGIAVREGKHSVCNDIENDPMATIWKDEALKRGYRSSIALPITLFGKVIGAFSLYASVPSFFDVEEITLLNEVAADISYALESIETETKRAEAEKSLFESELRFRDTLENIHLISVQINFNGELLYCNPYLCQITGYTREEIIGKDWFEIFIPSMNTDVRDLFQNALRKGEIETLFENPIRTKDGSIRIIRFSNTILRDSEGRVIGTTSIGEDITDRKLAEEKLLESEERMRRFVEASFEGIGVIENGTVIEANEQLAKMLRSTIADLLEKPLMQFIAPESQKIVIANIQSGQDKLTEVNAKAADGTIFPVEVRGRSMIHQGRQVRMTVLRDMTDWKLAEERLLQSENNYRYMFANNPQPMWIYDLETLAFVEVNEAAILHYGYTRDEFLSMNLKNIRPEEDVKALVKMIEKSLHQYNPGSIWRHRKKNGEIIYVEVISHAMIFKDRKSRHVMIIDVTERKLAEENIKNSEIRIRTLLHTIPDLIWLKDINGVYQSCNTVFERFYGAREADIIGKTDYDFTDRELADFFRENDRKAIYAGKPTTNEEWVTFADDGHRALLETTKTPMYDYNGNIIGVLGVGHDITERKMVEEKIREKDIQFRKLSANVSDLIFQFTRRNDGTYCVPIASEGIRNIFGCEPEDVTDDFTPIAKVIYPEDAARVISEIEYSAEHLTFFNCEFRVQIPGRPIQWILSRSNPEKLPDGSITWYGFNADITERRKADEEIQKQLEELRRWYDVTLDREGRVFELKKEVNEILKQFGEPLRYGSVIPDDTDEV